MSKLLPPNSTVFEHAFEDAFSRISDVPTPARTFNDPFDAPAVVLPWLAWEKSVDDWDIFWSDEQKRAVINASYKVHCHKGTLGGLEAAWGALGFTVRVQEWFNMQPQGEPYTFKIFIETSSAEVSTEHYKKLFTIIRNNKNLRSHLIDSTLIVTSELQAEVTVLTLLGNEYEYSTPAGALLLDGSWLLDGSQNLDGIKVN
ncbi:phage tail protein I [Acinetobacter baumannii]|jgi:phage tail P2-like protein|uniref:phage tail protein I n=1 Tax=Acinetobacter baumannii TaxID=470 RepID=UPI002448872A|nr:phage tail protein I [Acinetobacter baumannii]MDH2664585.1 phage tail protein I [Acinetobacter baumannii]